MKYKIWDKVKYLSNTTDSDAIVWEEYYITIIGLNNTSYLLWKEKGMLKMGMWVDETDIELVEEEKQPIYMVYVSWWTTPKKEHTNIEEAKKEAKRLAKKERKKSFVFELKAKYEIEIKEFNY